MLLEMHGEGPRGNSAPVKMLDPVKPSHTEIDERELTHLPFRNWCRECVHGRGVEMPHRVKARDEVDSLIHVLGFEGYCRRDHSRGCCARRENSDDIVKCRASQDHRRLRHKDVIVKSDQAPAVAAIVEDVGGRKAVVGGGR